MASLDDLLRQLGIGGVTRNRAGQIVTNTNDVIPVATAGLADTLYGAGRGTLAGTAAIGGIPGDINQMYVNKFGALFPNQPAPPTSEQISAAVKRAVPPLNLSRDNTGSVATSLGENVVAPITAPESLLGAARATKGMPVGMSIQDVSKTTNPVKGLIETAPDESLVKGVKAGEEMFVQHNVSTDKLIKADKLGGMPVPSLAISKTSAPLDTFGEITLIAPKEFAISSAKNPVFRSDAYTKTSPYTEFSIDSKSRNNLKNMFSDVVDKVPDAEYSFDRVFNNWKYKDDSNIFRAKFLNEKGLLPDANEFKEPGQFTQEVAYRIREMQPEYKDWLNNFDNSLPEMGVNVKETIFKGYTPSGNRKYAPADLENIVKEMKGGAGSQNWQGIGQLRAVASPRFRNFSEVKASRDKLLSGEKMNEIKEQSGKAYDNLITRLYDLSGYRADDALLEVAETRNLSALDRIYGEKMTPELKTDIYTYINKLKDLPTEYFEIKPQRAVGIEEFAGAIIPANSPKSVRNILEKRGVQNIYEYSTPEERKQLVKKFGNEMFAAAPVTGGLLGTQQDQRK